MQLEEPISDFSGEEGVTEHKDGYVKKLCKTCSNRNIPCPPTHTFRDKLLCLVKSKERTRSKEKLVRCYVRIIYNIPFANG